MPIAVKDYSWEETEKMVYITVPLKGVKPSKVDIFSTEEYIKVSYPPYYYECLLYRPVHDKSSKAEVGAGAVTFKLEKQQVELWGQLQSPDADNKAQMKVRREAAIERAHARVGEEKEEKATKEREAKRYALNQQMKLEEDEKKRVADLKESERRRATEELEKWKDEQKLRAEEEKKKEAQRRNEELKARLESNSVEAVQKEHSSKNKNHGNGADIFEDQKRSKKSQKPASATEAPMREPGKISVSFTERAFPTAARESTAPEEEAWLKKQAETRKIANLEDSDLSEQERNPVWLRDKGNSFFKAGNMHAAINAFTLAIRVSPKMPGLYSNRGACHLKLGNLIKCVEDCSKALDLLTPPVPQNAASRIKAHVRRGTAFCQLELYVEGLMDYDAALKLDSTNEQLQQDAARIRTVIQGSEK